MVSSTTTALAEIGIGVYGSIGDGNQNFAAIDGSGTTELVAAVTGMKIRLLSGLFNSTHGSTPPVIDLQTKPSGVAVSLTGEMSDQNNVNIVLPFNPAGWLESPSGQNLQMETAGTFTGCITYELVPG